MPLGCPDLDAQQQAAALVAAGQARQGDGFLAISWIRPGEDGPLEVYPPEPEGWSRMSRALLARIVRLEAVVHKGAVLMVVGADRAECDERLRRAEGLPGVSRGGSLS